MTQPLRRGLLAAAAVSLALLTLLVAAVGWRHVVDAVAAIGWTGFAVFNLYWLLVLGVAGSAWTAAARAPLRRLPLFVWARLLRESVADILPVSQVGGILAGTRALVAGGLSQEAAVAATVVDIAGEIASQAIFTLMGVGLMLFRLHTGVTPPILWAALGGAVLLTAGFWLFLRGHGRVVALMGRAVRRWVPDSAARAEAVTAIAERAFRDPVQMSLTVALHLAGWIVGGGASWLALKFMGAEVPFWAVIAVESLMYATRNIGFALPAGLGVQEGAYVVLGPLFGIPPGEALALSLLRRARDLVLGLPVLLVWQAREGRLIWRGRRPAQTRS